MVSPRFSRGFDPVSTPQTRRTAHEALEAKDLTRAMILALALNDYALLRKVYEEAANRAEIEIMI